MRRQELHPETRPGEDPVVEAYKAHVDRKLIRENLRRTVEERVRRLAELQRHAEELRKAERVLP